MDSKRRTTGQPSVHTLAEKARMTITVASADPAEGDVEQNTKVTYVEEKQTLRNTRSAAWKSVGASHRGPLRATAGGGSIATTKRAEAASRKGTSVVSSGARARRKPATIITMTQTTETTWRQEGTIEVSVEHVCTSCSTTKQNT
jgi:hypothetical protein